MGMPTLCHTNALSDDWFQRKGKLSEGGQSQRSRDELAYA
jgi:hypothetical protein